MSEDVVRLAVGVPTALIVAGVVQRRGARVGTAALLLAALVLPGTDLQAWTLGATAALGLALSLPRLPAAALWIAAAGAGALLVLVEAGSGPYGDAYDAVADERVMFVVAGLLVATFAAGQAVAWITAPVVPGSVGPDAEQRAAQESVAPGIRGAGRRIGWVERATLFALIVAGAVDAAAIVIAAKALVRIASVEKHRDLTEYYIVGTLASVALAVGIAIATRALLGLDPL